MAVHKYRVYDLKKKDKTFNEWCERNGYRATKVDTSCSGLMCVEWYRLREPDGFSFDVNVTTTNTGTTISRRS